MFANPRPAMLAIAVAALLAWPAARAANPAAAVGAEPAAALLADLRAGRLQAAEAALRGWPAGTPDDGARRQRLQVLVQQQRQRAARLLARAEASLQQRQLTEAVESTEAALALDDSLAQQPQAAALLAARSRLWRARDAVAHCMQPRDAACMDRAARQARELAPRDPAVALLLLQSAGWWVPAQARPPAAVEGTTGNR